MDNTDNDLRLLLGLMNRASDLGFASPESDVRDALRLYGRAEREGLAAAARWLADEASK